MKAICIKKSDNKYRIDHYFTVGKIYTYFIDDIRGYYLIYNDQDKVKSFQEWQFKNSFIDIVEMRENKLKELLGEN